MFRDEDERLQIPLEAMIHPIIPLSYATSRKEFVAKKDKDFLLDIPQVTSSTSFSMAWNEDGLFFGIHLPHTGPYTPEWPKYKNGDAVEVFIDTRNMRGFRLLHRFCHHFVLFPEALEGVSSKEITQFRTEQTRSLALDNSVKLELIQSKRNTQLVAYFPSDVLFGWNVDEIQAIGFAFSCHSSERTALPFSFPLNAKRVSLEQFPYRWATLQLMKNE